MEFLTQIFDAVPTLVFFLLLALAVILSCNIFKAYFLFLKKYRYKVEAAESLQSEVAALRTEVHALREERGA